MLNNKLHTKIRELQESRSIYQSVQMPGGEWWIEMTVLIHFLGQSLFAVTARPYPPLLAYCWRWGHPWRLVHSQKLVNVLKLFIPEPLFILAASHRFTDTDMGSGIGKQFVIINSPTLHFTIGHLPINAHNVEEGKHQKLDSVNSRKWIDIQFHSLFISTYFCSYSFYKQIHGSLFTSLQSSISTDIHMLEVQ